MSFEKFSPFYESPISFDETVRSGSGTFSIWHIKLSLKHRLRADKFRVFDLTFIDTFISARRYSKDATGQYPIGLLGRILSRLRTTDHQHRVPTRILSRRRRDSVKCHVCPTTTTFQPLVGSSTLWGTASGTTIRSGAAMGLTAPVVPTRF